MDGRVADRTSGSERVGAPCPIPWPLIPAPRGHRACRRDRHLASHLWRLLCLLSPSSLPTADVIVTLGQFSERMCGFVVCWRAGRGQKQRRGTGDQSRPGSRTAEEAISDKEFGPAKIWHPASSDREPEPVLLENLQAAGQTAKLPSVSRPLTLTACFFWCVSANFRLASPCAAPTQLHHAETKTSGLPGLLGERG